MRRNSQPTHSWGRERDGAGREERGERKVETDMGYDTGKKGKDDHRSHFGLFAF